jgi:AcrR family transcriptional regulator
MAADARTQVEARIRTAMSQLLSGSPPDGLKRDVKSLCALAGVPRATLYRAYPHLKAEFDQALGRLRDTGREPDARLVQIERLRTEVAGLHQRLSRATTTIAELENFRATALSRLTAQHDEITRLRRELDQAGSGQLRVIRGPP